MKITVNNIVTVTGGKPKHIGRTGRVVAVFNDNGRRVRVKFSSKDIMKRVLSEPDSIVFEEDNLKRERGWPIQYRAKELLGDTYSCIYKRPHKLTAKDGCEYLKCPRKASIRILINFCGIVFEMDACDGHAHLHGQCVEEFPMRPVYRPAVIVQD